MPDYSPTTIAPCLLADVARHEAHRQDRKA